MIAPKQRLFIKCVKELPPLPPNQSEVYAVVMYSYVADAYWTGETWDTDPARAFPFSSYKQADAFFEDMGRPSMGGVFWLKKSTQKGFINSPKFWMVHDDPKETFRSWEMHTPPFLQPPRNQFRFKELWQWLNKPRFSWMTVILAIIIQCVINIWWPR